MDVETLLNMTDDEISNYGIYITIKTKLDNLEKKFLSKMNTELKEDVVRDMKIEAEELAREIYYLIGDMDNEEEIFRNILGRYKVFSNLLEIDTLKND